MKLETDDRLPLLIRRKN